MNEDLPDPDVKVSHNEWYDTSWEMDFGKQIDEHTTLEVTSEAKQPTTQESTHTNDAAPTQQEETDVTEYTDNAAPTSPDFSNLTTDVGDNSYISRPH